jgi:hypothetical protein
MSKPNRYATKELAQSAYGIASVKRIRAPRVTPEREHAIRNGKAKVVPGTKTDRNCSYCGKPVYLAPTSYVNLQNYDMVIQCDICEKEDRRITLPH